jgi:hypothetical protein
MLDAPLLAFFLDALLSSMPVVFLFFDIPPAPKSLKALEFSELSYFESGKCSVRCISIFGTLIVCNKILSYISSLAASG